MANNNVNQLPLTTNYHVFPTRVKMLNFLNQVVNNGLAPVHPDILELSLYASVLDQVIGNYLTQLYTSIYYRQIC